MYPTRFLTEAAPSEWVFETIPAVVFLTVRPPTDFEAGLGLLFEAGGDVDIIAAMYGSCVGALNGHAGQLAEVQGIAEVVEHARRLGSRTD